MSAKSTCSPVRPLMEDWDPCGIILCRGRHAKAQIYDFIVRIRRSPKAVRRRAYVISIVRSLAGRHMNPFPDLPESITRYGNL